MQQLTILTRERCPYCAAFRRGLSELVKENPAYLAVPLTWIEETERPDLADPLDYWYVPTVFAGQKKLFEASPADTYPTLKEACRAALEAAMRA